MTLAFTDGSSSQCTDRPDLIRVLIRVIKRR